MHQHIQDETIFHEATEYFRDFIDGIHQAQKSILLESYIFSSSQIGDQIVNALIAAAERGVHVRILVDGFGIDTSFQPYAKLLRDVGARVRIYHPFPWDLQHWPMALTPSKGFKKVWYLATSMNKRNHRKILLVDKQRIWLGSFNISQHHLPYEAGGKNWRDTGVRVDLKNGTGVEAALNRTWYRWRWYKRRKQTLNKDSAEPFVFNYSRKLRKQSHQNLLSRLEHAQDRIWITNAYFVPDAKLLNALISASQRQVEVRIIIPDESDVAFIPWISRNFYAALIQSGARIFEYQSRILHAKTLMIDDWACIGSSNFNRRSLFHDLEVDYVLQSPEAIHTLEHLFIEDIAQCREHKKEDAFQRPLWQRLLGSVLLVILGYWV